MNFLLHSPSSGGGWRDVAYLFTDANGGKPVTVRVEEAPENLGFTAVGVSGPGPDHVRLPPDLEPGEYRVCEAFTFDEPMCARVTVQ